MNRGFTLLDVALGMALIILLLGIGVPRLRRPLDRMAVQRAVYDLSAAHQRARSVAVARHRVAILRLAADSLELRVLSGPDSILVWSRGGPTGYGVQLQGPSHWLRFAPSGISSGLGNGTWTLTKGGSQRRVIVSRAGRLRVTP